MENGAQTNGVRAPSETGLLAVANQNRVTGLRDFRAILLQTGQNDEIALIQHLAAEFLDIARTGSLFLLRATTLSLRESARGCGHQEHCRDQSKFQHCRPLFSNKRGCDSACYLAQMAACGIAIIRERAGHPFAEATDRIVRGTQAPRIAAKFAAADDFSRDCNILYSIVMLDVRETLLKGRWRSAFDRR